MVKMPPISSSSLLMASSMITPLRPVRLSRRLISVLYASCDDLGVIVGAVDVDENIKQLLNLGSIFVVNVKVVLYL
jgi:hypothetical protein